MRDSAVPAAGLVPARSKPEAMPDLTAQRTLVKSPPELWSELSEIETLARHLAELGEIKITKVEPETTVAWEGEQVSGTVELEQSGWGTKVTFSATVPEPEPPPVAEAEPALAEPAPVAPDHVQQILDGTLDALGQAHHRPFSRG